jgi:hypothetical protein
MIDSPQRLLAARGYGKFRAVRDAEFAVAAADFSSPNGHGKSMIKMYFLLNWTFDDIAARATRILEPSRLAPLSFPRILETMT